MNARTVPQLAWSLTRPIGVETYLAVHDATETTLARLAAPETVRQPVEALR